AVKSSFKLALQDVQQALYGKSEAEIKYMQEAFKSVGLDLEQTLRKQFDGVELAKALELLRHKDADVVPIPAGVDREAANKAVDLIHGLLDTWTGGPVSQGVLKALSPDQIKAVNDIYRAKYGIDLADDLKDKLSPEEFKEISKLLPPPEAAADVSKDAQPL